MLIEILNPDFIHQDERGKLIQLVHGGFNQINVIESHAGVLRGGHCHAENSEAFYIIEGTLILNVYNKMEKEEYEFHSGDMFLIPRNIIHSFYFKEETLLVSMYDHGVELPNGGKDIIKLIVEERSKTGECL
jgi:dTDP-4-dehydrorhamnose 3,5-epimerase-like enzyme